MILPINLRMVSKQRGEMRLWLNCGAVVRKALDSRVSIVLNIDNKTFQ